MVELLELRLEYQKAMIEVARWDGTRAAWMAWSAVERKVGWMAPWKAAGKVAKTAEQMA